MISPSLEDYLESIYKSEISDIEIKPLTISQELDKPLSRVVQAIQRLHYQKYLVYSPYKPIKLTNKGIELGKYIDSRNKLIKDFLELINLSDTNLDNELDAMKQYLSIETLESIEKFLLFNKQYPEINQRYKMVYNKIESGRLLYRIKDENEIWYNR